MFGWLTRWFFPIRSYRVYVWRDQWVPAGLVEAKDWHTAWTTARKKHRGWRVRIEEVE